MARRSCFVIFPIGDPGTPVRTRADQVFKHIIKPVTQQLKYRTKRADDMKRPGVVTSRVLTAVADSDLVVADLTDFNPIVFYELAIRHVAQRPVVHLIDAAQEPPFEVTNMRTVYVDIHDLDSAQRARKELKKHVRAADGDSSPVETPVTAAKSLRGLWDSKEPTDKFIREALSELRALKQDRLQRDHYAAHAEAAVQAFREPTTPSALAPNASPITLPKANVMGRPAGLDFDAGLFTSTNEPEKTHERDTRPAPSASSRRSRKHERDVSHGEE